VTAIDVSPAALAVARENAARHGVGDRVRFLAGDLFAPLATDERFDIIVSNPPYVSDGELETLAPDIQRHEPRVALSGGPSGLAVIERLIAGAPGHLAPGGLLLLEISPEQAEGVIGLLAAQNRFEPARAIKDAAGGLRVIAARLSP
jgi:release factor glutamine methyltransferase